MGLRLTGFFVPLTFFLIINSSASGRPPLETDKMNDWADSLLKTMSTDQKIGQLIMVAAYSKGDEDHYKNIEYLLRNNHIGGLVFFQGSPAEQVRLVRRYQKVAKLPLWIGMDAEWGANMRFNEVEPLPEPMTLGAVENNGLIYNYGAEVARQMKLLGVNINFAPVLDVNNNPLNPVINIRSFGEDPKSVGQKGVAYFKGHQDNGIITVGKHFPGHGDTKTDSHYSLPVINHDRNRLDSVEIYPFKQAIEKGIDGVMAGHLNIPSLGDQQQWPATLSPQIVTGVLKDQLSFNGPVFTDAMNMRGVTSILPSGKAELQAFKAGCDVLVLPVNVSKVFSEFRKAIYNNEITEARLNESVKKILKRKYPIKDQKLPDPNPMELVDALNRNAGSLSAEIFENAVTVVKNTGRLLPFRVIDTIRFASLSVHAENTGPFQHGLDQFAVFNHFFLKVKTEPEELQSKLEALEKYEVVIVSLHDLSFSPRNNFGLDQAELFFLERLNELTRVVLVGFGIPYSLKYFSHFDHVVCAYEDVEATHKIVPQVLFGAVAGKGKLPVSVNGHILAGESSPTSPIGRLGFSDPDREGFNTSYLDLIDTIIYRSIKERAMPGCQVLIARNGRVVFNENYGYHTYDSLEKVTSASLYDLASLTKVAGTVQALMMLYDRGYIDLDKKISYYLPELKNTNKEDLIIRDILTHQSGLFPYYPYWRNTLKRYSRGVSYYNNTSTDQYNIEVIDKLFTLSATKDTLWNWMVRSELRKKEDPDKPYDYKYSDIGFYIIQKLIEEVSGMALSTFLQTFLYDPLGLQHLAFLPKEKFDLKQIVPSAIDDTFRKGKIWGNVHDEIASLYGGVAGHAGLFSNAFDLARIMQMILQKGYYGGSDYFLPSTIDEFTSRQYLRNRRGLGWDKPEYVGDEYNPASYYASRSSYGHSGFTGTYTWVDPEYNLIYVFLSNRTYPDIDNRKLIDQDIRKRIQTIIYSSIHNHKK